MNVKILGIGCPACQSIYNDVNRIIARNGWQIDLEYVQDIARIMAYGVISTPVLVIDENVVMLGHRGPRKIEEVLCAAQESQPK